eukprot:CAMPEP_0116091644 /NCGR_PEP_ID=MMETSP0327-20121206/7615_1 /TAXON_ID=44447 /ORGANISM="Pseudo-nitzschia delicatissima, Strain B596" /LENGTH=594 /DNA_ID=CAMNT_0003583009 /DNA_START=72 /DNA_END=1856 /DNA_ORIENTATION=+
MKKAHCWSPSTAIVVLLTLCLCSFYGTISTVFLFQKWDSINNSTSHAQADQQQPNYSSKARNRETTRAITNTTNSSKGVQLDVGFGENNEGFLHPFVVQRIQTEISQLPLNATTGSNDDDVNFQRERLRVLEALVNHYSETTHRLDSDVVELNHCRLDIIDYSRFSSWAAVILLDAMPKFEGKLRRNSDEVKGLEGKENSVYLEFSLGLLEVFATHSKGETDLSICDFEKYSLNPRGADLLSAESALRSVPFHPDGNPRLVFVIIAFQDADHLEALIDACYMSHHLERRSPASFTDKVNKIANKYANVVIVQFGSIIYMTDSVSTLNYQIMHWVTEELKIPYDYFLTLGNAAYPLYDAQELTHYFQNTQRDIWLGELRSEMNAGWISWGYLERKRLIFTAGNQKYTQRTKKWKQNGFDAPIPDYIKSNMTQKTNSGNQAVFSHKVVKKLVNSPQVRELFGMAKYGCCCCLEERTWIAAANIIGHGREAMEAASMFQVWGGEAKCGDGSMKNALLIPNATICYKSEDLTKGNLSGRQQKDTEGTSVENSYFRGDTLLEELRLAKKRGFLFARKFKSTDQRSLELLEMIKTSVHNN